MDTQWRQLNIAFPDWDDAERVALTYLAPLLANAETGRLVGPWFFLRKAPHWRLRYQPPGDGTTAESRLLDAVSPLWHAGHITGVIPVIYEPETHAFGGPAAMTCAHRLFHLDSRHLVDHLTRHPDRPRRRELSVLLTTALLRAAGLDWYEQGDVWARLADHRNPPRPQSPDRQQALRDGMRRLMTADISQLANQEAAFTVPATWPLAFTAAGRELAGLASAGQLHRGLRAVLAHQLVFTFNRFGLPHATQATLAAGAKAVVFGTDPTTESPRTQGAPA
ncbi:thiopeptide-type bacteriocin biosynthesis protein [Streptomyces sp. NPDC090306]|uniref:thiopeptide-type bacteriocin biosynthesis protein n=1 Tax=Streptomyces sp. NPDC090306 TaxID=3365961 RepID=UPI003813F6B4